MVKVTLAFAAYIANALVTYYAGKLTAEDWDAIESYLSSNHYSLVMATIYLTYITNALVFIQPYVKKFVDWRGDDCRCCKVTHSLVIYVGASHISVPLGSVKPLSTYFLFLWRYTVFTRLEAGASIY